MLGALAGKLREAFDKATKATASWFVVLVLGLLAALGDVAIRLVLGPDCTSPPVSLVRLEVTYSAPRFASLLAAEGRCTQHVLWSFIPDVPFAAFYAIFLSALYVWLERQRRYGPGDEELPPLPSRWRDAFIVLPLVAGALDAILENVPLAIGGFAIRGAALSPHSLAAWILILIGSAAATLKWSILLVVVATIIVELLHGDRGLVVRRTRYSVLAVALGALPLLLLAQGQDILERLVEDAHPFGNVVSSLIAIAFAGTAVWFCGRKLVQLELTYDSQESRGVWYEFFAEHIPRILGVALIWLSGFAFAVAGLATVRFAVVALLDALAIYFVERRARRKRDAAVLDDAARVKALNRRHLTIALIITVLGAFIVWPHWMPFEKQSADSDAEQAITALRVAALLCLVATWVFYSLVYFRRDRALAQRKTVEAPVASITTIGTLRNGIVAAVLTSAVFLLLFTFAPVVTGRALGPLWVLALAVANAVFFGSLTVVAYAQWRIPLARVGLGLALLFSLWNDNHPVRTLPPPSGRDSVRAHLTRWVASGGNDPIVLVAAAGGGLRAAYWTALSLATLQDSEPTFANHVFAISGVSGGSLGAAVFAALVADARGRRLDSLCTNASRATSAPDTNATYTRCVRAFMRQDFLSPVLAKMVAPDLTQRFLPFRIVAFDRSTALEDSWTQSYTATTSQQTFAHGLTALGGDSISRSRVPALFLNATHVESGRRYVASQFHVADVLNDAVDELDTLKADLPLATAVHNSARFTYVSPAGHLERGDGNELGHVVDGGYFENSGLATLQELYALVRSDRTGPVAVLYLCNDPVGCKDTLQATAQSSFASELLAPARAVLAARDARGSLAKAQLQSTMRTVGGGFFELDVCDRLYAPPVATASQAHLDTVPALRRGRDRTVSPPLGWLLSKLARDWMDASLLGGPDASPSECVSRNISQVKSLLAMLRKSF